MCVHCYGIVDRELQICVHEVLLLTSFAIHFSLLFNPCTIALNLYKHLKCFTCMHIHVHVIGACASTVSLRHTFVVVVSLFDIACSRRRNRFDGDGMHKGGLI